MNLHRWHKVKKGEFCVGNPLHYAGGGRNRSNVLFISRTPRRSLDDTSDLACVVSSTSPFIFLGMSGKWCKILEPITQTIGYIGFTRIIPLYILNRRDPCRHASALQRQTIDPKRPPKHSHRNFFKKDSTLNRKSLGTEKGVVRHPVSIRLPTPVEFVQIDFDIDKL